MNFIDYIYYRLYKKYYKFDGKAAARALIFISGAETLLIGEIIGIVLKISFKEFLKNHSHIIANTIIFIGFVLLFFNQKYYQNKYQQLYYRFRYESEMKQKVKGWLIFSILILPWLLLYSLTKLKL